MASSISVFICIILIYYNIYIPSFLQVFRLHVFGKAMWQCVQPLQPFDHWIIIYRPCVVKCCSSSVGETGGEPHAKRLRDTAVIGHLYGKTYIYIH